MKRFLLLLALLCVAHHVMADATHYPLTVRSCNREVTFDKAPQHAVSHDVNMTQMMLALGLKSSMAGYSGITGWKALTPELQQQLDGLPELASKYPSVETLLNANVDFFFAGWDYGMHVGGDLTPQSLAPFGIKVYELTESCAFVMKRSGASLDDTYNDLRNLGRIFDVQDRANQVIAQMQQRVAKVEAAQPRDKPRVFLYDSGEDKPFTSGRLAMPQALITEAGGRNILDDVDASWTQVNWETVVERNPQVIVIVDYGEVSATQKEQFLLNNPALQSVEAIRNKRFIVIPYVAATPGIDNIEAIETIAAGLHGQTPLKLRLPPSIASQQGYSLLLIVLGLLLLATCVLSLGFGAAPVPAKVVGQILLHKLFGIDRPL